MLRAPDLAGRALNDRYELRALVGEGAFGRVYKGLDRRLARTVAVKLIKPWWAEDEHSVERFQREAQMLAGLNDPGIVQIFDFGEAEEGPYYVAEFIEGESLAERLRRGPLSPPDARALAEQLCRALGRAHAQGVIHCDVKPANVLLGADGTVKVGDFGVARFGWAGSQASTVTIAGTPRYMAPEQARGERATSATDVYSAGVVLYEMLAGRPPFTGSSPVELALRHLQERPAPLSGSVPSALQEVLEKALSKQPGDRYRDGAEMAGALRAASTTEHATSRQEGRAGASGAAAADDDGIADEVPEDGVTIVKPRRACPPEQGTATLIAPRSLERASLGARGPRTRRQARDPALLTAGERHGRSAYRRRIALVMFFAAGALVALVALLIKDIAASTTVPELTGLPRGGVVARARRSHVRPAFSKRYSDATGGIAIAQTPAAGAHIASGSTVRVVLSAGPPPVSVPDVVGRGASSAEQALSSDGLHYGVSLVAASESTPETVTAQAPAGGVTMHRGATVALSVAERPQWRTLTTFSGVDDGQSVPFQIRGKKWRLVYSMAYQGTCLLLVYCLGPSAEAQNLQSGSSFGGFKLSEGSEHVHTVASGPGLYRLKLSGGPDSARWSVTIQDYY